MDEDGERRIVMILRQEQIDDLPRRTPIGQAKLRAAAFEHLGSIKLGLARPTRKNLGMLWHAGAIVIFNFIVDRGHRRLLAGLRDKSAACRRRWQVGSDGRRPARSIGKNSVVSVMRADR